MRHTHNGLCPKCNEELINNPSGDGHWDKYCPFCDLMVSSAYEVEE